MPKNSKSVKNLCKTTSKTLRKTIEKLCGLFNLQKISVEKHTFPLIFPYFLTTFSTNQYSLYNPNLFHFFTGSTITIINKLEERN